MGNAMGQAEPPPWYSQAAAATGSPEQPRRGLLDALLRERAPRRCRHLLARSWWWCVVAISVAVGLLVPPAPRPSWWCGVAISVAVGLLAPLAPRPSWWCGVAISLAVCLLAPPASRPSCWCGLAISVAVGLFAPPAAQPWWWCGVAIFVAVGLLASLAARPRWWCAVAASFLTISARWPMNKGKPIPMALPDSRNDPAEIPSEETSRTEALITACYSAAPALFSSSKVGSFRKQAKDLSRLLLQVREGCGTRATCHHARIPVSEHIDFSLLDEKPLLELNCVDSVGITRVFCTDYIATFFALHNSIENLLSYMHVGIADTDATKVLVMGNVDVNEADPEQNTAIYLCLGVSSRTPEQRVVWFLLDNGAGVFKGKHIHCTMPVPKCVRLPEIFCFYLDEVEESVSDHKLPISPLITNTSEESPQQVDAGSNSTESQKDGDACGSRSKNVPVFIRHCSGLVMLTLNLDESSEHMMKLYEQKTKTKIANRYFSYGLKRIEPEHTLRFYGIARNATINLCGRLLGGKTDTLAKFVTDNRENFSVEITLPDGNVSLDMTRLGCLILLTLLKCFTHAFAHFRSWNGDITMNDFKVTDGHVRVIKTAEENLYSSSLQADFKILVNFIRRMFYKGNPKLISKYPPYLSGLITFLLSVRSSFLSDDDKLFIETHMACLESFARGMLSIKLRKKYKSLSPSKKMIWDGAIECLDMVPIYHPYPSVYQLSTVKVFDDIISYAKDENKPYSGSKRSTFRLMRDEFAHGPSNRFKKSTKPWKEKYKNDNGIELMVPAKFKDVLPTAIIRLIKAEGIDIKKELLAAQVRCTCPLCHPCNLEKNKGPSKKDKTKDGGETSKQGEGSSKGATQNAAAKASSQKMQPSTPRPSSSQDSPIPNLPPSQHKPKEPSAENGITKKKGKKKRPRARGESPRARGGYSVSMLWFSITICLLLFCLVVAAVFLL